MIEKPKYAATVGLDPASGLGTPQGTKLLAALQGNPSPVPTPTPMPVPPGMTAAQFQTLARQNLRKVFSADRTHEGWLDRMANGYFANLADQTIAATPTQ